MRSPTIHGHLGQAMKQLRGKKNIACRAAKAVGARARTCRGSRCARNLRLRSPTNICKDGDFGIWLTFADGALTRVRKNALTPSSMWLYRTNSSRFSQPG